MIERLRKRLIRIAILAVTAVLLLLCVIVNAANYISVASSQTRMLKMISENQGVIPPVPQSGKPDSGKDGAFTPETPFSTRYFVLRFQADGTLVPRSKPGAVIHDTDEAIARTIRMVKEGKVTAITGEEVEIAADSICVHGDNVSAVEFVKNIRARLEAEGVTLAPLSEIV